MAKRKRSKAARRMYAMGRGAGLKSTGKEAAAGAVTGLIAGKAAESFEMLRKAWYVTPGAVILAGHLAKGKLDRGTAGAIVGAGGAMAYFNYRLAKAAETAGIQDTGAVDDWMGSYPSLTEAAGIQDAPVSSGRPVSSVMGL